MDTNCDDNVDGGDLKGGIQGGAHRTAVYLGERCRYDHLSGPVDTPPERVSRNILVKRGVECGPARQTSAAPKIVPVTNPTTGTSSTIYALTKEFRGRSRQSEGVDYDNVLGNAAPKIQRTG